MIDNLEIGLFEHRFGDDKQKMIGKYLPVTTTPQNLQQICDLSYSWWSTDRTVPWDTDPINAINGNLDCLFSISFLTLSLERNFSDVHWTFLRWCSK